MPRKAKTSKNEAPEKVVPAKEITVEYGIATRNDVPQILELYKQLHPTIDPLENFSKRDANRTWNQIERDRVKYFIAKDGDKIVASCYIAIIPNLTYHGKSIGYIENVIVDEKYQRKGIGKKIMAMAIHHAMVNHCFKVVLLSTTHRTEAHKFYEKLGFNGEISKAFKLLI